MSDDYIKNYLEMALEGVPENRRSEFFDSLKSKYNKYKVDFEKVPKLIGISIDEVSANKLKDIAELISLEMIDDFGNANQSFDMVTTLIKTKLRFIVDAIDRLLGNDNLQSLTIIQPGGITISHEETIRSINRSVSEIKQIIGLEG